MKKRSISVVKANSRSRRSKTQKKEKQCKTQKLSYLSTEYGRESYVATVETRDNDPNICYRGSEPRIAEG